MRVRGFVALFLAAILIVAGLAYLALWGGEPRRSVAPGSGAAASGAAGPGHDALPSGSGPDANRDLAGGELVAVADSASSASESEWIELAVLRRDTRAPVSRAEVLWWPYPDGAEDENGPEPSTWFTEGELEQRVAQGSRRFHADDSGVVRLPPTERSVLLVGSAAGWWGYRVLRPDAEPPRELELARDADLRVQVVDGSGRPLAGVPIALRNRGENGFAHDLVRSLTREPDGIAVLPHAAFGAPYRLRGRPIVAARALVEPAAEVELDLDDLPGDPVRLVLEATGACEVHVVDVDGKPYRGALDVALRLKGPGEDQEPFHSRVRRSNGGERRWRVEGPTVLFDHVEPGRELVANVTRSGSSVSREATGPGPRAAGERVRLTVRLGSGVAVLRGRLIGLDGSPLAARTFRSRIEVDPSDFLDENLGVKSGADGGFQVDASPCDDPGRSAWVAVSITDESGAEIASARKPLQGELGAGVHELGDFVLVETPVLASGVVLDAEGRAVRGAQVIPSIQRSFGDGGGQSWWEPLSANAATTGPDGTFRIRSSAKSGSLSLAARKGTLEADPVRVESGAGDVVIVLGATGSIAGTVLLDPSLEMAWLHLTAKLVSGGRSPDGPQRFGDSPGRDGAFTIRGLPSGVYSVSVNDVHGGWRELETIEDVVVVAGGPTRDPRLDPLDLRDKHRAIRLEIVDESGVAVSSGQVLSWSREAQDARVASAAIDSGAAVLAISGAPLDVRIQSPGFLSLELDDVAESRRVTLRRAPMLRFVLARGALLPAAPVTLDVSLDPVEPDRARFWDDSPGSFDERGEARMPAPFLGRARLRFALTRRTATSTSTTYFDHEVREIEIVDSSTEQVFEVSVDPARLDEAVRSLERDR